MLPHRRNRSVRTGRQAFTIIEMLVVITIIAILAGILLPSLREARIEARLVKCLSNLKQIGAALNLYANHYPTESGGVGPEAYPPWLSLLMTTGGKKKFVPDPRLFQCPEDGVYFGGQGGRPDKMKYDGSSNIIQQFEMADIDEHPGVRDGNPSYPHNKKDGGMDCSYLFEYSGEPCDWIYGNPTSPPSPPIAPGSSSGVPDKDEWQWQSTGGYSGVPSWADFLTIADRDGDQILSWNEVKVLSFKGCHTTVGGNKYRLPAWGVRVPLARCYWHVQGQAVLKDSSVVLSLASDGGAAIRGVPMWYKD